MHYGRISLRFSDYDFKPYSFDGLGTDWPISYADMAPYYDKAEGFIGVTGTKEGMRTAPDGNFLPPGDAARPRSAGAEGLRQTRHPLHPVAAGGIDQVHQQAPGMPLLRAVRPGLPHGVELRCGAGADLPGVEERAPADHQQRDGSRAADRRFRQSRRRLLHRQDDPHREAGPLPDGGARGERLRERAPAAQLEESATCERTRELVGRGRPLSHR